MIRLLAHLLLAVAILAGQMGALEHPLVHLHGALHAQAADTDHDAPRDGHDGCDACVAYAGLGAGANVPAQPAVADSTVSNIPAGAEGALLPRAPPAFRSQAPPLFS